MKYIRMFESWEEVPSHLKRLEPQMKGKWWKWGKQEWLFVPEGKNPPKENFDSKNHPWLPSVIWISDLRNSWAAPADHLSPFYRGTGYRITYMLPGAISGNTYWLRNTENVPIFLELLDLNGRGELSPRTIGWFFDQVRKDLPGASMEKMKFDFMKSDVPITKNEMEILGIDSNKYRGALTRKKFGF